MKKKPQKELFEEERPPRIVTPEIQAATEAKNLDVLMDQFEVLKVLYKKVKRAYWDIREAAGIPRDIKHSEAIDLLKAKR